MRYHKFYPAFECTECNSSELRITYTEDGNGAAKAWLECVNCGAVEKAGNNIELVRLGKTVKVLTENGEDVVARAVPAGLVDKDSLRQAHLKALGVKTANEHIARTEDGQMWVNAKSLLNDMFGR